MTEQVKIGQSFIAEIVYLTKSFKPRRTSIKLSLKQILKKGEVRDLPEDVLVFRVHVPKRKAWKSLWWKKACDFSALDTYGGDTSLFFDDRDGHELRMYAEAEFPACMPQGSKDQFIQIIRVRRVTKKLQSRTRDRSMCCP